MKWPLGHGANLGSGRLLPWGRPANLMVVGVLFVALAGLRVAAGNADTAISVLYFLPITLLAVEFGIGGGIAGAAIAVGLIVGRVLVFDADLGHGEVILRCVLTAVAGMFLGLLFDRLARARDQVFDQVRYMESLTAHGLVRLDAGGSIVGWNRGATEIFGYSAEEVRSQSLALLLGGDRDAGSAPAEMLALASENGVWDGDRWIVEKGGQRRWGAVTVTPLKQAGSREFAVVVRDLTAVRAARHESQRMWDVSFEMLGTMRFDGYFQRLNPHWSEVLGWTSSELLAIPWADFVHPEDRAATERQALRLADSRYETTSFENRFRCSDGSYRWFLWNAKASAEDNLIYAAARDITERKRQEQELAQKETELRAQSQELEARVQSRTSELAAANRELEAFSYSIAHDLRAPLRAINGYSSAVLEDYEADLPDEARADLTRVRTASERMATLIDELLGLSRLTRRELLSAPVDLSSVAAQITGDLRAQDRGRTVEVEIDSGLDVTGDPELLRLVIQNLLENAWKFTARTEHARVDLKRVGESNGHSTFAVHDNGAGFDMRYADKLFTPFERLHRQDEFLGTGVGLTTVARVLNRHGGRIWAESSPGAGATFFFDLPNRQEQHA